MLSEGSSICLSVRLVQHTCDRLVESTQAVLKKVLRVQERLGCGIFSQGREAESRREYASDALRRSDNAYKL